MHCYYYPSSYSILHLIIGGTMTIPTKGKYICLNVLIYQCLQLLFNIRIFAIEGQIKKGNNVKHTFVKILEYLIGFILVQILVQIYYSNK